MIESIVTNDTLRQRLQLSLGARAELGEEIPASGCCRKFVAATRDGRVPVMVTVHPGLPHGLDPDLVIRRIQRLRTIEHSIVDVPLAEGDLGGRAWVMEGVPSLPAALDMLGEGPMPIQQGVAAIRELARALVGMHRRAIIHGSISLETVRIEGTFTRLSGVGQTMGTSVQDDLDALGETAWRMLSGIDGPVPPKGLSAVRRGVPAGLDSLFIAWSAPGDSDRPQRAERILELLDAVPTRRPLSVTSLVDVGFSDARPKKGVAWLVVGAAVLLLVFLLEARP